MFEIEYVRHGDLPAQEAQTVLTPGKYGVGQALSFASGGVAAASGTTAPAYLCMQSGTFAAGDTMVCLPVAADLICRTQLTAVGTALKVGDRVTLDASGTGVTATTTSGVAQIVAFIGDKSAGSDVLVQF